MSVSMSNKDIFALRKVNDVCHGLMQMPAVADQTRYLQTNKIVIMKKLFFACICALALTSCGSSITTPMAATSNPVGNKCGEASYVTKFWGMIGKRNVNIGIDKAAKSAGITKISHVDCSKKKYGFFGSRSKYTTKVYGE